MIIISLICRSASFINAGIGLAFLLSSNQTELFNLPLFFLGLFFLGIAGLFWTFADEGVVDI